MNRRIVRYGPVRGAGRDDRMDARAIGQPGVEHGPLLGDLAADPLGDVMDGGQQGVFAGKSGVGADQLARRSI